MQNRLLNASIESTLTLVVSGLCVALIAGGIFGMARPADTAVVVAPLERVVITSTKAATARVAQASSVVASVN